MRLLSLLLTLFAISAAQAQQPTAATITAQRDSVPVTTIVPVQQAPYTSTDTITEPARSVAHGDSHIFYKICFAVVICEIFHKGLHFVFLLGFF